MTNVRKDFNMAQAENRQMAGAEREGRPSHAQLRYLKAALGQPGGKLPLFDDLGQRIDAKTIQSCIRKGWAEPWFENPVKADWLVCRLTLSGERVAKSG